MTPAQCDAARFLRDELRRLKKRHAEDAAIMNGMRDVTKCCELSGRAADLFPLVQALDSYGTTLDELHTAAGELVRLADRIVPPMVLAGMSTSSKKA